MTGFPTPVTPCSVAMLLVRGDSINPARTWYHRTTARNNKDKCFTVAGISLKGIRAQLRHHGTCGDRCCRRRIDITLLKGASKDSRIFAVTCKKPGHTSYLPEK